MRAIRNEIRLEPRAPGRLKKTAHFHARYRDLTDAGFFTTRGGRAVLEYMGNTPSTTFVGTTLEVLRQGKLA